MQLTNKFDLPETFINVINRPTYSKGNSEISVTEILNSPRIVQLKRRHWNELEQDASEMVWQLFGSAVHQILEHGKSDHHIVEECIFLNFEGWRLSGAMDLQEVYEDGIVINDYKVTGAWTVMQEKLDWFLQLNMYAWMVEKAKGINVKEANIIAIVRDWKRREAETKSGYPKAPIVTLPIELLPFEEREAMVRKRLAMHAEAQMDAEIDAELIECSPEEMWEKQTSYALRKEGNVRAKSVHDSEEAAQKALEGLKDSKGYFIEVRPGERTRCESFCQVSGFCSQYQTYLKEKQ